MLVLTAGAEPAHADRCQPEELVTGPNSSPIPESADPKCPVMDELVYPLIGCPPAPATLPNCVMQVAGNPAGTATTIVGNVPNAPTYARNAAAGTMTNTVNFVFFVTFAANFDLYGAHDAACVALGGSPGRYGDMPFCFERDPL
jgi:hypothetical protein